MNRKNKSDGTGTFRHLARVLLVSFPGLKDSYWRVMKWIIYRIDNDAEKLRGGHLDPEVAADMQQGQHIQHPIVIAPLPGWNWRIPKRLGSRDFLC
jgi:hypothetical protein